MIRKFNKLMKAAVFTGLSMMSGATVFQSCGGDFGGYGDIYSNPYFPAYEQAWSSYATDVSINAAEAWDDYIRM